MISRNSIWRLLGSFLAIFFVSGAHAQVDYYSACDTIKGVEIVYIVTHDEYGGVYFENAKNSLMNEPIVWTDTGVRAIPETMPFAERDNKIVNEIIHKVFTKKEIKQFRKSKNIAEVGVIIDPMTGKSMEVAYTLTNLKEFNDPLLYSIPIQKFELLEILIKQELVWKVSPESKKASHIGKGFYLF